MNPVTQLISLLTATFIWSLTGLTESAANAAIIEALTVTSDNTGVLTIVKNADGTYTVTVVGLGTANLIVTTAEDLVNGIPAISQSFPFEVYDPTTVATHFTAAISDIIEKVPAPEAAAATDSAETASAAV